MTLGVTSFEDQSWKVKRYDPIRLVNDLADSKVSAHATKHIGVNGVDAVTLGQEVDHARYGIWTAAATR